VDLKKTKEFKKSKKRYFIFYKVFLSLGLGKGLKSPYQGWEFSKWGEHRENLSFSNEVIFDGTNIGKGVFHAYITEGHVPNDGGVELSVKVKKQDFVAVGDDDACFKAFTLTEKEWNRYLKICKQFVNYIRSNFEEKVSRKLINNIMPTVVEKDEKPSDFMNRLMTWSAAPEGYDYWHDLCDKLSKEGK
jgi:hypothetical protein